MSAAGSAAASGVILGLAGVLLAQQFAFLALSTVISTLEYLVVAALVGGVVCGAIGWTLGRGRSRDKAAAPN